MASSIRPGFALCRGLPTWEHNSGTSVGSRWVGWSEADRRTREMFSRSVSATQRNWSATATPWNRITLVEPISHFSCRNLVLLVITVSWSRGILWSLEALSNGLTPVRRMRWRSGTLKGHSTLSIVQILPALGLSSSGLWRLVRTQEVNRTKVLL